MAKTTIFSLCFLSFLILCSTYVEVSCSRLVYNLVSNLMYICAKTNFFFLLRLYRGNHGVLLKLVPLKTGWINLLTMYVCISHVNRSCQEGHVLNRIIFITMHHMLLILITGPLVNVIQVSQPQPSRILLSYFSVCILSIKNCCFS